MLIKAVRKIGGAVIDKTCGKPVGAAINLGIDIFEVAFPDFHQSVKKRIRRIRKKQQF